MTKLLLLFAALIVLAGTAEADRTKTIFNPFTGKSDYITDMPNSLVAGTGISISCTNGVCTITNTGGGGVASFILMEDASFILQEDGTKVQGE